MAESLPPNWRAAKDSDGKEYYFNELTGETSWVVPAEGDSRPEAAPVKVDIGGATDSGEFAPPSDVLPVATYGSTDGGNGSSHPRPAASSLAAKYQDVQATLGEEMMPRLLIVLACSIIVMVQSAISLSRPDGFAEGPKKYGIAVGAISLGFCLMLMGFARAKPALFSDWIVPKVPGQLTLMQLFAIFLVAWWGPAAFVLTFFAPFRQTSNAYFATWAATIAALFALGKSFARVASTFKALADSPVHSDDNAKSLLGLALSSFVVLVSAIEFAGEGLSEGIFALVIGCVSVLLSVFVYVLKDRKKIGMVLQKIFALMLFLLWIAVAIVTTFAQPFNTTGNGFFGTWFATACASSFAYQTFFGADLQLGRALARSLSFAPIVGPGLPMTTVSEESSVQPQVVPPMMPVTPSSNVA